jgi:hypothetical protein
VECHQFFISSQEIGDRALCDDHSPPAKILVDLWNAAMALIAEHPNQRNHIEDTPLHAVMPMLLPLEAR